MLKLLLAALVITAVIALLLSGSFLKINNINFAKDQKCIYENKQLEKFNVLGKNILFLSTPKLKQALTDEYRCIDNISIKKKFPSTIIITVTEKRPVAKIEGTDFQATEEGLVVKSDDNTEKPTLYLPQDVVAKEGERIENQTVVFALRVAADLLKSDFVPQNIRVVATNDVAVYDANNIVVIFSSTKTADEQVDSLQAILGRAKIDAAKISKIDLRFDKPIINYK